MSESEKIKLVSLTAIAALAGVLIAVISARSAFSEFWFFGFVIIFSGAIIILFGYMFLWDRSSRYVRLRVWRRRQNISARKCFGNFRDLVEKYTSLGEFRGGRSGVLEVLNNLASQMDIAKRLEIDASLMRFNAILQNPLSNFKTMVDETSWHYKSEISERLMKCLVKEFENYFFIHKNLYVDLVVGTARSIGLEKVSLETKRMYSEYRDDYNQFVVACTNFAERTARELGILSQHLPKANAM